MGGALLGLFPAVQPAVKAAAGVVTAGPAATWAHRAENFELARQGARDGGSGNGYDRGDAEATAKLLVARRLIIPVVGTRRANLRDTFAERRGAKAHEAIDIAAPRGTPVVAVDDGQVVKLYRSVAGGLTVYQFDGDSSFAYYYAHLDGFADGVREGMLLKRGDLIGYVGSTGNAERDAPHLHFAIFRLTPEKKWWKGTPVNPYPFLGDLAR